MSEKFPYGTDIDIYIDKALEKMQFTYPWATRELLDEKVSYAIEETDGQMEFVRYYTWDSGRTDREVKDLEKRSIVDYIAGDQAWYIELANPEKDVFEVPFEYGTDAHGWTLERYEFRTHVLGGYSSMVQAGNRSTGGSREFFIPPSYLEGTFSEFLDKYCEMVPGGAFGLYREDLENTPGLKEFLGFND